MPVARQLLSTERGNAYARLDLFRISRRNNRQTVDAGPRSGRVRHHHSAGYRGRDDGRLDGTRLRALRSWTACRIFHGTCWVDTLAGLVPHGRATASSLEALPG